MTEHAGLEIHIHDSLGAIDRQAWNALNGDDDPFLLYEFLSALETTGCLGEAHGWYPRYFTIVDADKTLLAACPAYIKTNSYGEFVFDWSWADAYRANGLEYYPKLVVSIPYTPATGRRLLVHPQADYPALAKLLALAIRQYAEEAKLTGVHCLFTNQQDTRTLEENGYRLRLGCQYHWQNHDYAGFADFLDQCTAKRRKTIKRERRSIEEQNLQLSVRSGDSLSRAEWRIVCELYTSTFDRKWGEASLNRAFFETVGKTMGDRFVIVFALFEDEIVACSVMLKSRDTLFGRYWGCRQTFHNLHFEACFYQG
ncbi:MAG: GNAT family N-acetyltransferase, partial [Gammaproteobacteria bacterium]|nr:GNAT family N-acetyltransferase [Gammaproteobacteria bacterium]